MNEEIKKDVDEWLYTTGAIHKASSWYFELMSIIDDYECKPRKGGEDDT